MQPSPMAETSRLLRPNLRFSISSSYAALEPALYCSSVTFSIQSTALPSSRSTIAMCVMAVVAVAPCQCSSPGGHQTTSPGRIFLIGPPRLWTRPQPAVTIRVCPSGCVCHAVRAPGSNVTLTPSPRAGSGGWNSGSMRTLPVKHSAGPFPEGWVPLLVMSIRLPYSFFDASRRTLDSSKPFYWPNAPRRRRARRVLFPAGAFLWALVRSGPADGGWDARTLGRDAERSAAARVIRPNQVIVGLTRGRPTVVRELRRTDPGRKAGQIIGESACDRSAIQIVGDGRRTRGPPDGAEIRIEDESSDLGGRRHGRIEIVTVRAERVTVSILVPKIGKGDRDIAAGRGQPVADVQVKGERRPSGNDRRSERGEGGAVSRQAHRHTGGFGPLVGERLQVGIAAGGAVECDASPRRSAGRRPVGTEAHERRPIFVQGHALRGRESRAVGGGQHDFVRDRPVHSSVRRGDEGASRSGRVQVVMLVIVVMLDDRPAERLRA